MPSGVERAVERAVVIQPLSRDLGGLDFDDLITINPTFSVCRATILSKKSRRG